MTFSQTYDVYMAHIQTKKVTTHAREYYIDKSNLFGSFGSSEEQDGLQCP